MIHKRVQNTRIVHCGFFIDAGSRDEKLSEHGLAHLLEHMLFKGTTKRNTHQVLNRLEVVGGELNAYTTKDKTCVYASVVKNHFSRAVDLLTDISFHASFPEKELARERKIIQEEIDMYTDVPEERIFDDFQELLFGEHPLAHNILGTKEHVAQLGANDLRLFRSEKYARENTVFVVVGDLTENRCIKVCEKYLGQVPLQNQKFARHAPVQFQQFQIERAEKYAQAHGAIGAPAYALNDPRRPSLLFLVNLLGGPSLNSRLSLNLREKKGYTYQVDCQYQGFSDCGMVSILWSTDAKNFRKSKRAIYTELDKIRTKELTPAQLKKYKTQIKGQLIMAEENNLSMLFVLGKGMLDLGRVESLNEILEEIDQITSQNVLEVANDVFAEKNLSSLSYLPS